jgi:uracil phosphoribosyltransferase
MAELDQYKFPAAMEGKTAVILDTMLATGGTINLAADLIWKQNPRQIFSVSILAVQDGIGRLSQKINRMFTVGMTDRLDSNQYIYPGVGDSGDRLYG